MQKDYHILEIEDKEQKSFHARSVLESLPDWFGDRASLQGDEASFPGGERAVSDCPRLLKECGEAGREVNRQEGSGTKSEVNTMRTPEEMLDLILGVAKEDERIRAVTMGGSRANRDCPADVYQDFDIAFFVNDVTPFWDNMEWIEEKFGMPSLLQKPESMELTPYERFKATYSDADYDNMWKAAFAMLTLFGDAARTVAAKLDFTYDELEEKGIEDYMKRVKEGRNSYDFGRV